ncbi:transmembrane emp24 domain-containing protein 3-like [Lineus longissimus]|uniref:transmembrane emp24 domain-containing protein 3-like n=1 Tax=Lineus longissimus TaxID=88925 RepID=UPI00315D5F68
MVNGNFAYGVTGAALSVMVEDNAKQCFYQDVEAPVRYKVDWRVTRGGHNDIDISIEKPNGEKELELLKSNHGTHVFDAMPGLYVMCFSNEFSTFAHKQVFFSFRPENVESLAEEAGQKVFPKAQTALEMSFENLHSHLTSVSSVQLDYRNKASLGHNVADHLNFCVQLMSLALAVVIFVVGAGQVMVLRLFFTDTYSSVQETLKKAAHTEFIDPMGAPM